MRVAVGRAIRVGPGDTVVIRGRLASGEKLGRLFIFAKEGDAEFSPYVENLNQMLAVSGERPQMYSPVSMRLDSVRPEREISFMSDIDGYVRVMQEIDRPKDTRAVVKLKRTINPHLPWQQRLTRKLSGLISWSN